MSYQTGTATDLEDLLSKVATFAVANGWTEDERNNSTGDLALSKVGTDDSVYVSFRWDPASKQHLSVHQALGYTPGNDSGNHPDDSGNGYNATSSHSNANLALERHVSDLGDGPFSSYHIFEDDDYLHVEVQVSSGVYRRFGFGVLSPKYGTYTGGAYAYGCKVGLTTNHNATDSSDTTLLDGIGTEEDQQATVHVEGLPNQVAAGKWGVCVARTVDPSDTDTAGNARELLQGGFRGGPVAVPMGVFSGSALTGNVPMYSILAWHNDTDTDRVRPVGVLPNVRALNIRSFEPEEEVSIGGDTWVVFPMGNRTEANVAGRTYYSGIAHKKVTA